jgi:hypothetical protein
MCLFSDKITLKIYYIYDPNKQKANFPIKSHLYIYTTRTNKVKFPIKSHFYIYTTWTNKANFPIKSHLDIYDPNKQSQFFDKITLICIRPEQTKPIYGRFLECCWFLTLWVEGIRVCIGFALLKLRMVGPKVPNWEKRKKS